MHTYIGTALPLPLLYYFVGGLDVSSVTYLVLHKVDEMLHIGLERKIRGVLSRVRPDRQTVMTRYGNGSWQLLAVILNNCVFDIGHSLIVVAGL
jgi:hypothetical protein